MAELIAELFVTLDGSAAGRESSAYFGFPGPDLDRWIDAKAGEQQTLLMGRLTYELMASMVGDEPVAGGDGMTEFPKVVFSRTVRGPLTWANSRLAEQSLIDEVRALKQASHGVLRTLGSLSLVRQLLTAGLVDRLVLVVFPQILGRTGLERIFDGLGDFDLSLITTRVLDERLVLLEYRPRPRAARAT